MKEVKAAHIWTHGNTTKAHSERKRGYGFVGGRRVDGVTRRARRDRGEM